MRNTDAEMSVNYRTGAPRKRSHPWKRSLWGMMLVMVSTDGFLHRLKLRRKLQNNVNIHERSNLLVPLTENNRQSTTRGQNSREEALPNSSQKSFLNVTTQVVRDEEEECNQNQDSSAYALHANNISAEKKKPLNNSLTRQPNGDVDEIYPFSDRADDSAQTPQTEKRAENQLSDTPSYQERSESSIARDMWKSRNAKTAEEGIRNEKTTNQLSSVLAKAEDNLNGPGREYAARTITGLINALAEEVTDLKVEVKTQPDSPFWRKQIDAIKIDFSRLAFKPLKLGGSVGTADPFQAAASNSLSVNSSDLFSELACIDEVFDQIDADKSGALDTDEIAQALNLATLVSAVDQVKHEDVIKNLASDLVKLYDFNGDGVVDRYEYRSLVEDMAALRKSRESTTEEDINSTSQLREGLVATAKRITGDLIGRLVWRLGIAGKKDTPLDEDNIMLKETVRNTENFTDKQTEGYRDVTRHFLNDYDASQMTKKGLRLGEKVVNLTDSPDLEKIAQGIGSITLSDLKLDLRRLFFGAIPLLKRITPGGPLVLEPFTVTIDGSFSREDIMDSFLLDAGLRRLVAMALRRRVGSLRDFLEGALFHGRSWKLNSESGPSVNVPKLTNVEFDSENRLIITGRARVQSNKDAPVIENAFKVRTKIGTRKGGKVIRLVEPELALVLECPKAFEENLSKLCSALDLPQPPRPKPIYSFFPIYSPFKVDDNDGFDLGEDNSINSIYIQDGALHFQLSAVLRPGRFLGSHYIAFTVPIRTFIVTLDRVREGMRAARQAKNAVKDGMTAKREKARTKIEQAIDAELSRTSDRNTTKRGQPPKSFFSRFVDGYLQAERDFSDKARLTQAIGDFFGRQGTAPSGVASRKKSVASESSQENRNETKTN